MTQRRSAADTCKADDAEEDDGADASRVKAGAGCCRLKRMRSDLARVVDGCTLIPRTCVSVCRTASRMMISLSPMYVLGEYINAFAFGVVRRI